MVLRLKQYNTAGSACLMLSLVLIINVEIVLKSVCVALCGHAVCLFIYALIRLPNLDDRTFENYR
jgi:hypothetical protein